MDNFPGIVVDQIQDYGREETIGDTNQKLIKKPGQLKTLARNPVGQNYMASDARLTWTPESLIEFEAYSQFIVGDTISNLRARILPLDRFTD